jgi:hypothetical protein
MYTQLASININIFNIYMPNYGRTNEPIFRKRCSNFHFYTERTRGYRYVPVIDVEQFASAKVIPWDLVLMLNFHYPIVFVDFNLFLFPRFINVFLLNSKWVLFFSYTLLLQENNWNFRKPIKNRKMHTIYWYSMFVLYWFSLGFALSWSFEYFCVACKTKMFGVFFF